MSSNLKVLQVIPKLGHGGAETGCYDVAHYLPENNCKSFIVTSGGELIKFINKEKVKLIKLPVNSKNPLIILFNSIDGTIIHSEFSLLFPASMMILFSPYCSTSINRTQIHGEIMW